jgi:hypothetical protein
MERAVDLGASPLVRPLAASHSSPFDVGLHKNCSDARERKNAGGAGRAFRSLEPSDAGNAHFVRSNLLISKESRPRGQPAHETRWR